ncbi:hypothetical protein KM043_001912 [Ampulex compressa]|nr:hypothetical protein KM043_001912 [Ampulex compressa]
MADSRSGSRRFLLLLCSTCFYSVLANPTVIPVQRVADSLTQTALNSLNEDSPTHHTYRGGNLISAQKLLEPPYTVYRLTFDLNPVCKETLEPCSREICTIELKEHENGRTIVLKDSIQCAYLYPQSVQNDPREVQESTQHREVVENVEKQMVNEHNANLDRELESATDQSDKVIVPSRAENPPYCPGCPFELNLSLPGLRIFGEEVTSSMDELIKNDYKHKLVRILKATRAVPPSSTSVQYELLLEIGESNCLKNELAEQSDCALRVDIPVKTCLVRFEEQPWQQSSRKLTKNNCTMTQTISPHPNLQIESLTTTIQMKEQSGLEENKDVFENLRDMLENFTYAPLSSKQDEQVQDLPLATENPIVKTILNVSNNEESHDFQDKVKEFEDFLKDFDIPIKEGSLTTDPSNNNHREVEEIVLEKKVILAHSQSDKGNEGNINRSKRSNSISTSEEDEIHKLAKLAIDIMNDYDDKQKTLIKVMNSKKHKSHKAKIIYFLTLKVHEVGDSSNSVKICDLQVHTNEDHDNARVTYISCSPEVNKLSRVTRYAAKRLAGGVTTLRVDHPDVKDMANKGLQKFSENLEGTNEPIIVEIVNATSQVVSGMLYKIVVKLGASNCPKGIKENCELKSGSDIKECLFTIWSQPWLDHGSPNIQIDCGLSGSRARRALGARYNDKMLKLAEELRTERLFMNFMDVFNKTYTTIQEKAFRLDNFRNSLKTIKELRDNEQGTGEYGVTEFADLARYEFELHHLGLRTDLAYDNEIPYPAAKIPDIELPNEFDWRHYNVVTPVKDQGQCGSCWAFSVTGNIEGLYAHKYGKLLSFSEQELIDCDKMDEGCNGGLPDTAYRAIEALGGLETEADYPYDARDESNETDMAKWLVQNGPISIGINANAMQFYFGGVSHPFKVLCSPKNLDHGVLIVGYGVSTYPLFHKKLPYWIIKNSWGARWGEQGYYRVYRGDGTCGVNAMPTSAVIA